ncbi:MAG TPA: hypothetical protein VK656_04940 [Candidatus Acidoferrum sp.]|nr:hypothetical protein [Candidatus Acidoferrum sp.]
MSPETATATPTAAKRPTKFLADLTRAMQAAAEEARTQAVSQLEAEAKAYIESIHAQSSGQASELRKRADDDVASIREWSKAELARVREATEERIAARKVELEAQLQRHAGVIEHEIERVNGQVGNFETEMTRFFEGLLAEQDPTRFAALAESLPEPPPFGTIAMDLDELLASATLASTSGASAAAVAEPATTQARTVPADTAPAIEAEAGSAETGSAETGSAQTADMNSDEALASMRAALDAATHAEAEAARAEAAAERAEAAAETTGHHDSGDGDTQPETSAQGTSTDGKSKAEAATVDATSETAGPAAAEANDRRPGKIQLDDFDAAEAEAVADAVDAEDIPVIDDDALSARLDGLMPDRANNPKPAAKPSGDTSTTQVVVVGLVSVASIASFKRHLGRIPHVDSVGVSSGPDGEFVFTVTHDGDVSLREVVATLPGFQARVTNAGDGIVNVTAHDPESEG